MAAWTPPGSFSGKTETTEWASERPGSIRQSIAMHLPIGQWKKLRKRWQCYRIAMAVNVRPTSQKEQWIQGGERGGNLNSQIPAPQENMWLRLFLRDENFFVSHAKLTIFKASPTLSNLTELGSMCIPLHYAASFATTGDLRTQLSLRCLDCPPHHHLTFLSNHLYPSPHCHVC